MREAAASRGLVVVDATCPLVTKVHNEARRFANQEYLMIYIGHRGHVEAEGTMGEAPDRMILVETVAEAETLVLPPHEKLALVTQTTLSVEEVHEIQSVLMKRFPHLRLPTKEDICYATTNRQGAVRAMAELCDVVLVVGSTTSSNSNRLREVAEALGRRSYLLMSPEEVQDAWLEGAESVGITSGASTPDELVNALIDELMRRAPEAKLEILTTVEEKVEFKPHRDLIALAQAKG